MGERRGGACALIMEEEMVEVAVVLGLEARLLSKGEGLLVVVADRREVCGGWAE